MKRLTMCLLVIVVLFVPVHVFAQGGRSGGTIELTVWFGRENFIPDGKFDAFHAKYPNIRVKPDVIPLEQVLTEAASAISSGVGPDIIQTDSRRLPPLAEGGLLKPMDQYIEMWKKEAPDNYKALSSSAWDHSQHKGVMYGVTVFSGPFNHVYRLDWLREAGLAPPKTMEDILVVAEKLKGAGRFGYSIVGPNTTPWFFSHYMAAGGTFDERNIIQLDSEAGIYTLRWYQTLIRNGLVSPDTLGWGSGDARAAFITGRAAQTHEGNNIFPNIQKELKYGTQWASVPPLPRKGAESKAAYASLGWPMVVTANTKHPYEASLVLRYLAEHANARSVARRYQPTTVITVWSDPSYLAEQPWAADFAKPMLSMTRTPATLYITQVDQIVLDALGDVMKNVNADVAAVAKKYQQRLNALGR